MKTMNRSLPYKRGAVSAALLCVLMLSTSRGQATKQMATSPNIPTYAVKDVGLLPGFTQMTGTAINIAGNIVGTAYTGFDTNGQGVGGHAFLYRGKLTDLGPSAATAINARGEVLGYRLDSLGNNIPFLYQNGTFTALPANAYALNDRGQILIQATWCDRSWSKVS